MSVEVFRTNVFSGVAAKKVLIHLQERFPGVAMNFDLEDRDKILRIEAHYLVPHDVVDEVVRLGFVCEPLT